MEHDLLSLAPLPPPTPSASQISASEHAPYPPPSRACLVCGQQSWRFIGDRYRCDSGAPAHQERESMPWIHVRQPVSSED